MKYLQKKHRIGNTETSFPGKERSGVIRSPPSGVLRVWSGTTAETSQYLPTSGGEEDLVGENGLHYTLLCTSMYAFILPAH